MPIKTTSGFSSSGKASLKVIAFVLCIAITVSSSLVVFAGSGAVDVTVKDDRNSVTVKTELRDPKKIVAEAGFVLDSNDTLNLDSYSEENGGTIIIERARLVRIENDGIVEYVLASANTVEGLLSSGGILIDEDDNSPLSDVRTFIKRAFTVKIDNGGKKSKISMTSGTVADALKKAGITLGENDTVSPSLDTPLSGFSEIKINRVTYKLRTEKEKIEYTTTIKFDSSMAVNETKTVKKGSDGLKSVVYTDKYVNGKLQSSEVKSEVVIKAPVNRVVKAGELKSSDLADYYGTGTAISELKVPSSIKFDKNGIPTEYKECISAKATAYTGDPITSTGIVPKPGYIAVDPKEIPYGTELYIVSADGKYVYGYCIAADTGGFVQMGNTDVDLFMNNEQMCLDWGNRAIKIYVLS